MSELINAAVSIKDPFTLFAFLAVIVALASERRQFLRRSSSDWMPAATVRAVQLVAWVEWAIGVGGRISLRPG